MTTSFRYRQSAPQLHRMLQPEFRGRLTVRSGRIFCHGHRALLGDRPFLDAVAEAEEGAAVTVVDFEIGWPDELRRDDMAASPVWTWNAAGPDRRSYTPTATIRS